jgi:hypothetical protein
MWWPSVSEWVVIGFAAACLAKPGDVGRAARVLGWSAGRAVRASEHAAQAMHSLAGRDQQLAKLKTELSESLQQVKQMQAKIDRVRYDALSPWTLDGGKNHSIQAQNIPTATADSSLSLAQKDREGVKNVIEESDSSSSPEQQAGQGLATYGMDAKLHAAGLEVELRGGAADLLIESIIERKVAKTMKRLGGTDNDMTS